MWRRRERKDYFSNFLVLNPNIVGYELVYYIVANSTKMRGPNIERLKKGAKRRNAFRTDAKIYQFFRKKIFWGYEDLNICENSTSFFF